MTTQSHHILVTNDDGFQAPGLQALAEALADIARVSVIAPERNWSASGHTKTLHRPLRVHEARLSNGMPVLATDGAPSDAVALGLMGLITTPIDLIVTGINQGANFGHDLTYSGTVTAAMESVISGIPAFAISLDTRAETADYTTAAQFAAHLAQKVLIHSLPPGLLLNVNIPNRPRTEIKGIQVTRMGMRLYHDRLVVREDPSGKPYYWIGGDPPTGIVEEGTDFGALAAGYISVTPIQLDFTAYDFLEPLRTWQLYDWPSLT